MSVETTVFAQRRLLIGACASLSLSNSLRASAQSGSSKFGDVLVVLPGIMGTVLTRAGRELWAPSASALFDALVSLGQNLDILKLASDPLEADALGDDIRAERLVAGVHLIPGLWNISGYSNLIQTLGGIPGVTLNENLFTFPYDWRRDCRVAARQLGRKCDEWLSQWRKKSGNNNAKFVFVAHSMGGLVARHYIEVLEGWRNTKKLITIGTPYLGSVKALDYLSNGFPKLLSTIDLSAITNLVRTFTSVYQLLPTYKCVETSQGHLERLRRVDSLPRHVSKNTLLRAAAFHNDIDGAVKKHQSVEGYSRGYKTLVFMGTGQPTAQACQIDASGKLKVMSILPGNTAAETGDGTVSRISAIPSELVVNGVVNVDGISPYNGAHDSLQDLREVSTNLTNTLTIDKVVAYRGEVSLGIEVEDAYVLGSLIAIGALAEFSSAQPMKQLQLTVRSATTNEVVLSRTVSVASNSRTTVEGTITSRGLYAATLSDLASLKGVSTTFLVA